MSKWDIFRTIMPECWIQEQVQGGGKIWRLTEEWVTQYYPGQYHSITRDGDPFNNSWRICRFVAANKMVDEITLYSFRTQAPEYYDFKWSMFDHFAKPAPIDRFKNGQKSGTATIQSGNGIATILIQCPEINEEVHVNLQTLRISVTETKQEKQHKILPWMRMLWWYGRLQQLDPQAFARIPWAIQNHVRGPGFEAAASNLTPEQVHTWQQQKLLPEEFPWLWDNNLPDVVKSIQLLQQVVNDPRRQANAIYMPQIPHLLKCVDATKLDLLDLKVFMAIGAVREVWGYKAREWNKLLERRPELKEMCQTPEGKTMVENDPEWQMICNHPLAIKEQDDEMEAFQHRRGDHGPTPKEKLRASELETQRMFNNMMAQDAQINAMMGMYGVPTMSPLPQMDWSSPYLKEEPPPAWKIYKPYMI